MICRKCNRQISDKAIFCDNCGAEQQRMRKCDKCGADLLDNSLFCMQCGSPNKAASPAAGKTPKSTLISAGIAVVLALALLSTNVLWLSGANAKPADEDMDSPSETDMSEQESEDRNKDSNKSFSTPEDTIDYFAECMSSEDSEGAQKAFAISEQASGFDAGVYIERIGAYTPMMLSPSSNSIYIPINEDELAGKASTQIKNFIYSIILPDQFINGMSISEQDLTMGISGTVEAMADTSKLKNLNLVRADMTAPDVQQSEQTQKFLIISAKSFGADSAVDYVMLYELDGDYYLGGAFLLEYNGSWKIQSLNSQLAGTSSMGNLEKITKADYMDMINGFSYGDSSNPDGSDSTNSNEAVGTTAYETAATTAAAAETTAP